MCLPLTLADWLERLVGLHSTEIDLGLVRVREVGQRLAVLCPAPFVITVAGTNGKGSSVAMLESIFMQAGYRVGSYTSPHMLHFNERIKLNGQPVSDALIVQAFERIERARGQISLTYFEFATLAGLQIFQQSELDVVVLEVGLGGRLDAVNIVDADACLLTAIDIDHSEWLGTDRNTIGFEKAGVMRPERLAVCSDPNSPDSVVKHAQNIGANLSLLGQDFSYQIQSEGWQFSFKGETWTLPNPALMGAFQCQNAAGVLALLMQSGFDISQDQFSAGLLELKHPGRLQHQQINHQAWLFDVAHNVQSVSVLADYLSQQPIAGWIAIFAGLADKDLQPMVEKILPFVDHWVLVDLAVSRATKLDRLENLVQSAGVSERKISRFNTMGQAVESVQATQYDHVLVYGSFITVSQAMEVLNG